MPKSPNRSNVTHLPETHNQNQHQNNWNGKFNFNWLYESIYESFKLKKVDSNFIWEISDIYSRLLRSFTARGFTSRDPTRV